jgi:phage tail sheath gpL-like
MNFTKAGVPTTGVLQVETAQIVGTITQSGNAKLTITGAGITGSPLDVSVAVLLNDTATQSAAKMATALNANAAVSALYTATSNVADLLLTAVKCAANDATLNIAYTNDTCTGLTPDASSNDSTAGVRGDFRGAPSLALALNTSANAMYQNTGTSSCPVWTEV